MSKSNLKQFHYCFPARIKSSIKINSADDCFKCLCKHIRLSICSLFFLSFSQLKIRADPDTFTDQCKSFFPFKFFFPFLPKIVTPAEAGIQFRNTGFRVKPGMTKWDL